MNLRQIDSVLEGHPTGRMPLIKIASGSLGQGLNAGVGMALAKKLAGDRAGSSSCWATGRRPKAASGRPPIAPPGYRLDNLVVIVDANRLGQSGPTRHGHDLAAYERKFRAFGWETAVVDGHDVKALLDALCRARLRRQAAGGHRQDLQGQGRLLSGRQGGLARQAAERRTELQAALAEIGKAEVTLPCGYSPSPAIVHFP